MNNVNDSKPLLNDKMESLRRLSGKIAHDLNNILTTIMGYVDLLAIEDALDESSREFIAEIKQSTVKAATLTNRLLVFSRNELINPERIDVNAMIRSLEPALESTLGDHIELRLDLDPSIPPARSDVARLEQALLHMAENSRDAMPGGGALTVRTRNVLSVDPEETGDPPEGALIDIEDTGCGMEPGVLEHIFEPFFTTRESGDRPGLGLSLAYTTILQSGGSIRCESEPDHGTVFRIRLPPCP